MATETNTRVQGQVKGGAEDEWQRPTDNGFRRTGLMILWALAISAPILGAGGMKIYGGSA